MTPMNRRVFPVLAALSLFFFVTAPIVIIRAPYESTMGLVQKIFYFHFPAWMAMFLAIFVLGIASVQYLFRRKPAADRLAVAAAEMAVIFGLMGLITGPLWGIKAWGVWWQWDARLTMAVILELILVAYLLLRQYGGAGSERLAAGIGIFAMANVPFLYVSTEIWRTVHPRTSVVPTLPVDFGLPLWWSFAGFIVLCMALLSARTRLEAQRAALDRLYLAVEED
jgi:heme exporter protein C